MNKFGPVLWVILIVFIAEMLMLIIIPFLADVTVSVNTTLNASSNMSQYPGTSGFLLSTPWILYFVPPAIGIIAVIIILKSQPG